MPIPPLKKQCIRNKQRNDRLYRERRRQNENAEEEFNRREQDRVNTSISRAQETSKEQESRRQSNRNRMNQLRALETPEERERRREEDRVSTAFSRALEIPEERERRIEEHRVATAISRALGTQEERETRREENRVATAISRALETHEQQETRRVSNRDGMHRSRMQRWVNKENTAYSYDPNIDYASDTLCTIGSMSFTCQFCDSLKWKDETPGMCCSGGKIHLPKLVDPPEPLCTLLSSSSGESKHFQRSIRRYNSCFQMTSFGTSKRISESGYMPTFKIQGQVYHRIGSLLPPPNEEPKFLQIYFTGNDVQQAERRCRMVPQVRQDLVLQLQELLNRENPYISSFKMAMEKMTPQLRVIIHADKTPQGEHERRFNVPTISEVAVILAGDQHGTRDIVLETRNSSVQKICDTHRSYDTLQYPLMFWQGEDGYNFELRQTNPSTGAITTKKISAMDFYAYRIMVRRSSFNIILRSNELFHQYIVDMYAKIESERLRYIRLNQKKLRVEDYVHLRDSVMTDGNVSNVGQLVILPATFTGGPRYMHERTQDAMTYVRNYGRPDLFITFTCNPAWEEIKQELFPGQKPHDRHDLLSRVFHAKLKVLLNLITKAKVFGSVRCYMYTIEWQKRGLPHAHILVWLQQSLHVHRINDFISAEIPNNELDPQLFQCITTQMVHGPCGMISPLSPCMKDGKCTKRYPRKFLKDTQTGRDGYPLYRRRSPEDGGFTTNISIRQKSIQIDNRWIVPYCPLLSRIFNAHINVEYCNSIKSIKYVCKYINKGSDMAVFDVAGSGHNDGNEVLQYEMGRYISSNEAVWRILNFPIHERSPTVVHLSVHLENGQRIYFTEDNAVERARLPPETTLTAFFRLCTEDDFARNLFYHQVPNFYTWDNRNKKWSRRKVGQPVPEHPGIKSSDALGRVYTVHPNNSECFHLRMLLHEVTGPVSFEVLRTVDGTLCETYKEACQRRGLLENDEHWNLTLEEAAATRSPRMLRDLFAIMLQTCAMSNPNQMWINHREDFSEDLLFQARVQQQNMDLQFNPDIFNAALILIENRIAALGGPDLKSFALPQPVRDSNSITTNELIRESSFNLDELTRYLQDNEHKMVQDQREAFEKITQAVFQRNGGIFFLDAPGGTGKTFLINIILAKVRQRKQVALAVASSGIAATLLSGGRTAHSAFKLPLNLATTENPTCNISRRTGTAALLKECRLIVWDECTMSHKTAFEALDSTLKDLRHNNHRMGGVTLLLAGDFRQTLPVIPRGTRADEMRASLRSSYIWNEIQRLELKTNMRVHLTGDPLAQEFAETLLTLGNGSLSSNSNDSSISVQNLGKVVNTHEELLQSVFPNLMQRFQDHSWLSNRAILAPQNEAVEITNKLLLSQIPGNLHLYKSIDTVCETEDAVNYPTEFLNSLELPGVPSHVLELKIGAPIILLRNLNPPSLCNGTRLSIKRLSCHIIEATILTGQAVGKDVLIPRIPIIPSDVPFQFKRLQFPVRLSFAMSINKSQGQSLKVVGLDLQNPCFSHGQLYVGCSRVGSSDNLYIFAPNGRTLNIVYPEALQP